MTKLEQLQMDRDTVLEHIETVNSMLYEEQVHIHKLKQMIEEIQNHG